MGNAPSSGKPPKVTSQDRAILQLKLQRDKLNRSQQRIAAVVKREEQIARECVAKGNRQRALLALRKKKHQESMLGQVQSQADTLEQLIGTIEFKLIEKDVIYGLEQGNKVLKQLNQETSLDRVEKILDDTEEGIRYQQEVSDLLGEAMTQGEEDEVEEELERMAREAEAEKFPKVAESPLLPDAPSTVISEAGQEEAPVHAPETEPEPAPRHGPIAA
ncbi:unnamed protein product [Kuraishia capsulata CBS 1993]|uniref:Charged multivesicular body protein 6 n=1 Tax=Kuraishia capsulata CBS 1993 TaxID=1382522 RepID=W6MX99_9ASCO|nr:uncharacterized protein KUCA_T00004503001 [Kuraishia capsulata CBS 1993]CDK28520.1 unnamed protein product [Kuraishia capsulata CBS 1993]